MIPRLASKRLKLTVMLLVLAGGIGGWLCLTRPGRNDPIQGALVSLRQHPAADQTMLLASLRQQLALLRNDRASQQIREFLDSGSNAVTGSEFTLEKNGDLKTAPTLRLFLLDHLARINPSAAAEYSRSILNRMDSADEWALALRNIARQTSAPADFDFLEDKFRQMLQHDRWQKHPSAGFLEAFDLPVFLGRTNLVPDLARWMQQMENQAMAHAAYLALDRLVIAKPETTLLQLQTDPTLMQGREATRANYFARADVQDPRQRQILEGYLLSPNLSADEVTKFAGLYPNANFMISDNLLTRVQTSDGATLAQRDDAALQTVNTWLADPRFARCRPQLAQIQKRLEEFKRLRARPN
jgi:hypothetical protein